MSAPFPGMNPYLEHPDRWSTVHNKLIVAIADALTPQLLPHYQVDIEKRIYDVMGFDVSLPVAEEVHEAYLEVREVATQRVITVIEVLSLTNKKGSGRQKYLDKRQTILTSQTHLVEIDLLREGEPLPLRNGDEQADYRILVSRAEQRPEADLYSFCLSEPIPIFPVPVATPEASPLIDLKALLNGIYDRSGYAVFIDYETDPQPSLATPEQAWLEDYLKAEGLRSPD